MAKDNRHKLSNFYIRHMAKGLARQRYGACIGAMAVLFGVALALGQLRGYYAQGATDSLRSLITGLLIAFLSLIVTAPANVGARGVFCDIAAQRETRATKALAWYGDGKRLSSSILLMLAQTLIALAALTLFGGLALAVLYRVDPLFFAALLSGNLFFLLLSVHKLYLLLLAVFGPTYLIMARFAPAAYLLAEQPEKGPLACMKESSKLLKGFYWKYIGLQLLSLLQLIGYALMASIFCMLIFDGDINSAAAYAAVFTEVAAYFSIMPQLGIGTALFIKDARVQNREPEPAQTDEAGTL